MKSFWSCHLIISSSCSNDHVAVYTPMFNLGLFYCWMFVVELDVCSRVGCL